MKLEKKDGGGVDSGVDSIVTGTADETGTKDGGGVDSGVTGTADETEIADETGTKDGFGSDSIVNGDTTEGGVFDPKLLGNMTLGGWLDKESAAVKISLLSHCCCFTRFFAIFWSSFAAVLASWNIITITKVNMVHIPTQPYWHRN